MVYLRENHRRNCLYWSFRVYVGLMEVKVLTTLWLYFGKWGHRCSQRGHLTCFRPYSRYCQFFGSSPCRRSSFLYRSLNAHRSAISSIHDTVDRYEVCKHPPSWRVPTMPDPCFQDTFLVCTCSCWALVSMNNHLCGLVRINSRL